MRGYFTYGNQDIQYDIIRNSELNKKIRINVHPNGAVQVETPDQSASPEINIAVQKRARWITQQLQAAAEIRSHALIREYISGETHFYLGRRHRLRIIEDKDAPSSVKLKAGCIEIILRNSDPAAIRRRLNTWYRNKANDYFTRRLQHIIARISWIESPPSMKIITMKKQWGSCSPSGTINLNPWLIRAPSDCIDYVITHELCHLKEHNHSKRYYDLLERHYPNWGPVKAKLDGIAELLLAI